MDYGNVFSRAWRICWNNKFLFLLGFLAALGSGSSGGGGGQGFNYSTGSSELPPGVVENIERVLAVMGTILGILACVVIVLGLVLWLIRLVAQAGLISAAAHLDRGERYSFGASFSAGTTYLPRFLGLNILIFLPFLILLLISIGVGIFGLGAAIASVLASNGGGDLGVLPAGSAILALCGIGLMCLLAPLYVLATVVYAFAQRSIVLQDMGVTQSIRYAWRFVREHAGDVILLIIFLVVLPFLFGALVSVVTIPISLLAFGPIIFDLFRGVTLQTSDLIFAGVGLLGLALVSALLNSIFIAFRSVTVTLGYQDLLAKGDGKPLQQGL